MLRGRAFRGHKAAGRGRVLRRTEKIPLRQDCRRSAPYASRYGVHEIQKHVPPMSRFVECLCLSDLEIKAGELCAEYSHVEFVQWLPGNVAQFYCV